MATSMGATYSLLQRYRSAEGPMGSRHRARGVGRSWGIGGGGGYRPVGLASPRAPRRLALLDPGEGRAGVSPAIA